MSAMRPLVIGVGNSHRHDDGAGLAVADALRHAAARGSLDIVDSGGDPAALLDHWTGRSLVLLVDATRSGAAAGTVHRVEVGDDITPAATAAPASGHGLGVAEAVALGRALHRMPRRLVIYGIEADDVSHGVGLSPRAAAAVGAVVDAVLSEVEVQR